MPSKNVRFFFFLFCLPLKRHTIFPTLLMADTFTFKKHQKVYLFFKRAMDIFGSLLGIILLSWLMLILAIITKCTSKGPAIYKQKRIGKNEKLFTMYKFRSMRTDMREVGANELSDEEYEAATTKWGRFLRKSSLDEFPQLFNVFKGDMSFIGPRPMIEGDKEPKCYNARKATNPTAFEIKPGLCSLAIIKMHRSHSPIEKANYDSEYIRKVSMKMDVYVFLCAVGILFGLRPKDKGH